MRRMWTHPHRKNLPQIAGGLQIRNIPGGCKGACQRLQVLRGIAIVQPIATPLATRIARPFGLQDSTALKRERRIRHLLFTFLSTFRSYFCFVQYQIESGTAYSRRVAIP